MKILKNIYQKFEYMLECIEEIHDHLVDIKYNTEDILDYIEILVEKEKDQEIEQTLKEYFGDDMSFEYEKYKELEEALDWDIVKKYAPNSGKTFIELKKETMKNIIKCFESISQEKENKHD